LRAQCHQLSAHRLGFDVHFHRSRFDYHLSGHADLNGQREYSTGVHARLAYSRQQLYRRCGLHGSIKQLGQHQDGLLDSHSQLVINRDDRRIHEQYDELYNFSFPDLFQWCRRGLELIKFRPHDAGSRPVKYHSCRVHILADFIRQCQWTNGQHLVWQQPIGLHGHGKRVRKCERPNERHRSRLCFDLISEPVCRQRINQLVPCHCIKPRLVLQCESRSIDRSLQLFRSGRSIGDHADIDHYHDHFDLIAGSSYDLKPFRKRHRQRKPSSTVVLCLS